MGKYRKEKFNDLIRDEVGQILLQELDPDSDALVTVTRAIVSEDSHHAKVYVSVLPADQGEETLDQIKKQVYFFQQILNKKLRMRPIPKIYFVLDRTEEEAAKIEKILGKTKD